MSYYITLNFMVCVQGSQVLVEIRSLHVSDTRLESTSTTITCLDTLLYGSARNLSLYVNFGRRETKVILGLLRKLARRRMENGVVIPPILNVGTRQG
jgi:uncharacterized protein with von Willebrand factor type A (vWA) domain